MNKDLSYDKLNELYNYFKSEYMLLSLSYNSLRNDYKSLKSKYSTLKVRFDNLQKIIDSKISSNKLYFSDYSIFKDSEL